MSGRTVMRSVALPGDIASRVLRAAAFELVDRHHVGVVEHVDLLEL